MYFRGRRLEASVSVRDPDSVVRKCAALSRTKTFVQEINEPLAA